jgi:uncharacterized protein YvpB
VIFICFFLAGFNCYNEQDLKARHIMNINLQIESGQMFVVYKNNSPAVIRIWQSDNSWGWENLSFILRAENSGSMINIARTSTMGWTKNGPGYDEMLPGQQTKIPVQLMEKSWEADKDLSKIKNEPVSVKALFTITETSEAKQLNIWIGKSESAWLRVQPPHNWLFPAN